MTSSTRLHATLPRGVTLLERGWLSSNNVVLFDDEQCVLVDSGYVSHSAQTLALVAAVTQGRPLDILINTHLHSDHCGGNALLQSTFPSLQTFIAPGESAFVSPWTPEKLSHQATGQRCEPFTFTAVIYPGQTLTLGGREWLVMQAPGHDPHAIMLWCESQRILISADALWENGFGIVFPELVGISAFDEVECTLNAIECLQPQWVLPGHGRAISDVDAALRRARSRLEQFRTRPAEHTHYALKALLKFLLLDRRIMSWTETRDWVIRSELIGQALDRGCRQGYASIDPISAATWQTNSPSEAWLATAVDQLKASGALATDGENLWDV